MSICLIVMAIIGIGLLIARQTTKKDTTKIQIVASFYPLYEFAQQVGGDRVSVRSITPAGAEPHDYESSPQEIAQAMNADVFIYNGANFEPWVTKLLPEFKQTTIAASQNIPLLPAQAETHTDHDDHDDGEVDSSTNMTDPHFWIDPVYAQQIVDTIVDGLVKADPAGAAYYHQRGDTYKQALAKVADGYQKGLATCQRRTVITSHQAFSYVAKRYNLEVHPIAGISPSNEPSSAALAQIVELVRSTGVTTIFFETGVSSRLADTIAKETGATTAVFDPIEGITDEDRQKGKNYITIQQENIRQLQRALACQ